MSLPDVLRDAGHRPGEPLALVTVVGGLAVAYAGRAWSVASPAPEVQVGALSAALSPRWVWWSAGSTAAPMVAAGQRLAACWDLGAVHRLLHGGALSDPAHVWAGVRRLPTDAIPRAGQLDLFAPAGDPADGDPDEPVRPDGYLRPEWALGAWRGGPVGDAGTLGRAQRWAALALEVYAAQLADLAQLPDARLDPGDPALPVLTAWSESAADLLALELQHDGLPVDRAEVEALLRAAIGPPPADAAEAEEARRRRDDVVLRHLSPGAAVDLRNPGSVRTMLATVGLDLPDTRSWRLERHRGASPLVDALLAWRKAERLATTYGYGWLDRHVGADGRLRGAWSGSDGGAGRMTAQAGLHNLPAELRPAVLAESGSVFVRADLGQIEPRVLAAVSRDPGLTAATADDDLYSPVAAALGADRPTAKIAVLAAMYGQTSGAAGQALRRMERAYPAALTYLRHHEEEGRAGRDVRTYGGRRVVVGGLPLGTSGDPERAERAAIGSRGRFARNAVVQGAAAELFKMWAVTVRAGLGDAGRVVLCLHDELLLQVTEDAAEQAVQVVHRSLEQAAGRWSRGSGVRFVADVSVVRRWSDAKG